MINYYNKNILYLSNIINDDVISKYDKYSKNLISKDSINKMCKSFIIRHIIYLLDKVIYDFLVDIEIISNDDIFLMVYDMDRLSVDVFYNYDFEKIGKVKERKLKIQEIFEE
jgi:hypothetical protein